MAVAERLEGSHTAVLDQHGRHGDHDRGGAHLVLYPHATVFLLAIRPFVEGYTLMLWVWGSWWIPFLVLIGVWKYGVFRERIAYDPALWSIVFPLGMYTVACETLERIDGLRLVQGIAPVFVWIAVAAWCAVAGLFVWSCMRMKGDNGYGYGHATE